MKVVPVSNILRNEYVSSVNNKKARPSVLDSSYSKSLSQVIFSGNAIQKTEFEYGYTEEQLLDRLSPAKYSTYTLLSAESDAYKNLSVDDKKALMHLVKASEYLDPVFKRLDNPHNLEFEKFLSKGVMRGDLQAVQTKKLYDGQRGLIGKATDGSDVVLAKNFKGLQGNGFYPEDLSEEEFHKILIKMLNEGKNEEVKSILNQRSVVEREGDELKAIDYTEFFKKEFTKAADELEKAAKISSNEDFNEYLRLQAAALRKNDPHLDEAADKKWAKLQYTPLEFTLGRECYSDKMTPTVYKNKELLGLLKKNNIPVYAKDDIGVRVGIVDKKGTDYLLQIKKFLPFMAEKMPLNNLYEQNVLQPDKANQSMVDAHIVAVTGRNGAYRGGVSIASNLPNSDKLAVQNGGGFRNVYNIEIRESKYSENASNKLNALLNPYQQKYYKRDALHDFTILHENLHSLGPKKGLESLGTTKNIIEEFKADAGAIVMLDELRKKGFYTPQKEKEVITSLLTAYIPKGPDSSSAHKIRNIMQYNYYFERDAIRLDQEGRMKINYQEVVRCAREMLYDSIDIQLMQDEKAAKDYIDRFYYWSDELDLLSGKLKAVDTRLNAQIKAPLAEQLLRGEI